MSASPLFERIALIGIGLIGSSLARVARRDGLAGQVVACARREETLAKARALDLADVFTDDPVAAVADADLVVLCTPVGAYGALARAIGPHLATGAIVTDVGSVKGAAIANIAPHIPAGAHFVPGHPVAGTERSGPEAGFDSLFEGRWCILTPAADCDPDAVERVAELWRHAGMLIELMDVTHHDRVLAITSHLPHLIAYSIVDTVVELEQSTQKQVIKYAAGGFRDFTRIAASDPVMWRDIFLQNSGPVLEMLGRFSEDLARLQRAIRHGEGEVLEDYFTRTRAIRRGVIDAKQA